MMMTHYRRQRSFTNVTNNHLPRPKSLDGSPRPSPRREASPRPRLSPRRRSSSSNNSHSQPPRKMKRVKRRVRNIIIKLVCSSSLFSVFCSRLDHGEYCTLKIWLAIALALVFHWLTCLMLTIFAFLTDMEYIFFTAFAIFLETNFCIIGIYKNAF